MNAYPNPFATFVPKTPDYEPEVNPEVTVKLELETYADWTEKKVKSYGVVYTKEINEKYCAVSRVVVLKEDYDTLPSDMNQIGDLSLIDVMLSDYDLDDDDDLENYKEVVIMIWLHFKELFEIVIDWADVNDLYKAILKNDRVFLSEIALHAQYKFEQFKDDYYLFVSIQKDLFLKDLNKTIKNFE
mgnify:CR=1 FL=1